MKASVVYYRYLFIFYQGECMKKLLLALGLVCAFQAQCKAMVQDSVPDELKLEPEIVTSESFNHNFHLLGSHFRSGFNNAITFPMAEELKIKMFDQGMKLVKTGEFELMFVREVKFVDGFYSTYVAHILYAIQPCYNGEWTRVRHGGYFGEENVWVAGFTKMFEKIQELTQKPLACLVQDHPENETWKRVITSLGFVAQPDIPREADDQDCIWYVRPLQQN